MRRGDGQSTTNTQVVIQIDANGVSADAAIENANKIAPLVCAEMKLLFPDATINVINQAVGIREPATHGNWLNIRLGQRSDFELTPVSDTISFASSEILLALSSEWQQHYVFGMQCPPALIGVGNLKGQFLTAHLYGREHVNFEAVVAARAEVVKNFKQSTTDSLQEDSFATESGLHVVRLSYNRNSNSRGGVLRSKTCEYFTTNAAGRFIRIEHIAVPAGHTNEVHQTILRTLKLK